MFVFCKTCKKDEEPVLDESTLVNKAVVPTTVAMCVVCKTEMPLTIFVKKSLLSMKRIHKKRPKGAFEYDCIKCKDFKPALVKDDQAICADCGSQFTLTPFMLTALKLAKGSNKKRVDDDTL